MDNTITALQALYVALGGDADDVADINIIPDMINAIATVAGTIATKANTAELPAVTTSDAGSVLKVNASGKWAVGADAIE